VNLVKSCCAVFDYGTNNRVQTGDVTYRGVPLPEQALHEPIRYLGMLLTLTHDSKSENKRHRSEWRCWNELLSSPHRRAKRWCSLQSSPFFGTRQVWYHRECPNWKNSRQCGFVDNAAHGGYIGLQTTPFSGSAEGKGCPSALSVWITETVGLIAQCVRLPGGAAHDWGSSASLYIAWAPNSVSTAEDGQAGPLHENQNSSRVAGEPP
jgi:hypothetical protein